MSSELVKYQERFVALKDAPRVAALVRENLGKKGLNIFDLERIRLPSGAPAGDRYNWAIESPGGGGSHVESIECVIPYRRSDRQFWSKAFGDGERGPPDCFSINLDDQPIEMGIGDNGTGMGEHRCASCPQNKFGSAKKGQGKACREVRLLFVLRTGREGALFPSFCTVTPGSIKSWEKYAQWLIDAHQLSYKWVVHKLELTVAQTPGQIKYAQVKPTFVRALTEDERAAVIAYSSVVEASFSRMIAPAEDVLGTE